MGFGDKTQRRGGTEEYLCREKEGIWRGSRSNRFAISPFQRICNPLEPFGGFVIHIYIVLITGLKIPIELFIGLQIRWNRVERRNKDCKSDGTEATEMRNDNAKSGTTTIIRIKLITLFPLHNQLQNYTYNLPDLKQIPD